MIANVPSDDRLIIHLDTKGPNDARLTTVFVLAVLDELRTQGFEEMELVGVRPGSLTIEVLSLAGAVLGAVGAGLGLAAAAMTLSKSMKSGETEVSDAAVELMDKTQATQITLTVATQIVVVQRQEIIVRGAEPNYPDTARGDLADDDVAALRKIEFNNTGEVKLRWERDYDVTPEEMDASVNSISNLRGTFAVLRGREGVNLDNGKFYSIDRLRGSLPFRHGEYISVSGNILPPGTNNGTETLIATRIAKAYRD